MQSSAALLGDSNELLLKAILDRLDESVEFGLPDLDARKAGESASTHQKTADVGHFQSPLWYFNIGIENGHRNHGFTLENGHFP